MNAILMFPSCRLLMKLEIILFFFSSLGFFVGETFTGFIKEVFASLAWIWLVSTSYKKKFKKVKLESGSDSDLYYYDGRQLQPVRKEPGAAVNLKLRESVPSSAAASTPTCASSLDKLGATSSVLASSFLASPRLSSLRLASPSLDSPRLAFSRLASSGFVSSGLAPSSLASPCERLKKQKGFCWSLDCLCVSGGPCYSLGAPSPKLETQWYRCVSSSVPSWALACEAIVQAHIQVNPVVVSTCSVAPVVSVNALSSSSVGPSSLCGFPSVVVAGPSFSCCAALPPVSVGLCSLASMEMAPPALVCSSPVLSRPASSVGTSPVGVSTSSSAGCSLPVSVALSSSVEVSSAACVSPSSFVGSPTPGSVCSSPVVTGRSFPVVSGTSSPEVVLTCFSLGEGCLPVAAVSSSFFADALSSPNDVASFSPPAVGLPSPVVAGLSPSLGSQPSSPVGAVPVTPVGVSASSSLGAGSSSPLGAASLSFADGDPSSPYSVGVSSPVAADIIPVPVVPLKVSAAISSGLITALGAKSANVDEEAQPRPGEKRKSPPPSPTTPPRSPRRALSVENIPHPVPLVLPGRVIAKPRLSKVQREREEQEWQDVVDILDEESK